MSDVITKQEVLITGLQKLFATYPDGKTVLPVELIVNKMGSSIVLDVKIRLNVTKNDSCKQAKKGI
jgi:hypothetical protein